MSKVKKKVKTNIYSRLVSYSDLRRWGINARPTSIPIGIDIDSLERKYRDVVLPYEDEEEINYFGETNWGNDYFTADELREHNPNNFFFREVNEAEWERAREAGREEFLRYHNDADE